MAKSFWTTSSSGPTRPFYLERLKNVVIMTKICSRLKSFVVVLRNFVEIFFSFSPTSEKFDTRHFRDIFIVLMRSLWYQRFDDPTIHMAKATSQNYYPLYQNFFNDSLQQSSLSQKIDILQFRGKFLCNNDNYCNEWLNKFWYEGRY